MSKPKYVGEEWSIALGIDHHEIASDSGRTVIEDLGLFRIDGDDAVLIAAAPALLRLLRTAIKYMPNYQHEAPCDSGLGTLTDAQALIEKLTGEKS